MANKKVELSVDNCFLRFAYSFNRVKYFSCISENITKQSLPNEWVIENSNKINLSMQDPKDKDSLLKVYKHFIQLYLVRDCIESFALCLDELFFIFLLNGKSIQSDYSLLGALSNEELELKENFHNKGLYGKVEGLENQFNLKLQSDSKRVITSLKEIRNCLSHSLGTVRKDDGQKDGKEKRKFRWKTINWVMEEKETGLQSELKIGGFIKKESFLLIKLENHFKSFKIGEIMNFSPIESNDIAFSLQIITDEYKTLIRNLLKEKENIS